jgi:tRNA threonylcarbamoyladenosine biosynthesis protein TsaB
LLLKHIARTSEQITAIGVALGPGSWSGLRVGVSTAKGMALARNLPIVGIGTLDALAYQHACAGMPVYPLIRLGRDRFATALFVETDRWPREDEYRNVTLVELCAEVEGQALFCGDVDSEARSILQNTLQQRAHFPRPATNVRRPAYLAELAWQRLQSGNTDDLAALEPIYLGHPVKTGAGDQGSGVLNKEQKTKN